MFIERDTYLIYTLLIAFFSAFVCVQNNNQDHHNEIAHTMNKETKIKSLLTFHTGFIIRINLSLKRVGLVFFGCVYCDQETTNKFND